MKHRTITPESHPSTATDYNTVLNEPASPFVGEDAPFFVGEDAPFYQRLLQRLRPTTVKGASVEEIYKTVFPGGHEFVGENKEFYERKSLRNNGVEPRIESPFDLDSK